MLLYRAFLQLVRLLMLQQPRLLVVLLQLVLRRLLWSLLPLVLESPKSKPSLSSGASRT